MLLEFVILLIISFAFYLSCGSNVVIALLCFIGIIFSISFVLFWFGIEFLALAFLIIYIGAIIVLFLFVVFIFNLETITKLVRINLFNKNNIIEEFCIFIFLCGLLKVVFIIYTYLIDFLLLIERLEELNFTYISPISFLFHFNEIELIGVYIYIHSKIYLIIIAFLLLLAIIGSVLLVRQK